MKCKFCGFETEGGFDFCPNCSKQREDLNTEIIPVSLNPAADIVLNALKDKLFLIVCILVSTATLFNLANDTVNIIGILLKIS